MDENKKNEIIKSMMEVEYYPEVQPESVDKKDSIKFPLEKLSALGVAFEPLVSGIQTIITGGEGTSGIYYVNTKGLTMAKFKDGSGFLGSLLTDTGAVGGGQAAMNKLTFNPTMLFMAAALMQIEKKLDTIQETQTKILEFLEEKKKAEMTGNLKYLSEIMTSYKFNYNNDKFINTMLVKVQDVKQSSEQDIDFCCTRIQKLFLKRSFFVEGKEMKSKLDEICSQFKNYQLATYLYAFSSFLHVLLLKNFDGKHLNYISNKLKNISLQYRELYTDCYNKIEELSSSTMQSRLLGGFAEANKAAGTIIRKIPVIEKGSLDEGLLAVSSKLNEINSNKTEDRLNEFIQYRSSYMNSFIENIDTINNLYNTPIQVCFDQKNMYYIPNK